MSFWKMIGLMALWGTAQQALAHEIAARAQKLESEGFQQVEQRIQTQQSRKFYFYKKLTHGTEFYEVIYSTPERSDWYSFAKRHAALRIEGTWFDTTTSEFGGNQSLPRATARFAFHIKSYDMVSDTLLIDQIALGELQDQEMPRHWIPIVKVEDLEAVFQSELTLRRSAQGSHLWVDETNRLFVRIGDEGELLGAFLPSDSNRYAAFRGGEIAPPASFAGRLLCDGALAQK